MKKLFVTLSLLLLSSTAFSLSYTMEVTEKELQKKVQMFMPLSQKNNFVSVTAKDPVIDMRKDSDKIALSAFIDATVMGSIKGNGVIDVAGNIYYDKDSGSFFLQNIEVLNFKSDSIDASYQDIVKMLAGEILNTALKTHPIYQFDTTSTKGKLAKSVVKSVKVKDEKLQIKLKAF